MGPNAGVDPEVVQLISRHIHSVMELEVLLFLRREVDRLWTPEAVAQSLYLDPGAAGTMLAELQNRGFLHQGDGGYIYGPSADDARALDKLADVYAARRVTIVGMIFSKPGEAQEAGAPAPEKKPGSVQSFADAFRLKKEG